MVSAITQSFGETVIEGDIREPSNLSTNNLTDLFNVRVKRVELFEKPLNHINMDLELGLTWKRSGEDQAREFSSVRQVRAASLGSITNTSSTLLDNLSRIVDTELNGAVEEMMQEVCSASVADKIR